MIKLISPRWLFALVLILLIGIIFEIWMVNRLATFGEDIRRMEELTTQLETENQLLKNQIYKLSSLMDIDQKAQKLGFEKVKHITALNSNQSF